MKKIYTINVLLAICENLGRHNKHESGGSFDRTVVVHTNLDIFMQHGFGEIEEHGASPDPEVVHVRIREFQGDNHVAIETEKTLDIKFNTRHDGQILMPSVTYRGIVFDWNDFQIDFIESVIARLIQEGKWNSKG